MLLRLEFQASDDSVLGILSRAKFMNLDSGTRVFITKGRSTRHTAAGGKTPLRWWTYLTTERPLLSLLWRRGAVSERYHSGRTPLVSLVCSAMLMLSMLDRRNAPCGPALTVSVLPWTIKHTIFRFMLLLTTARRGYVVFKSANAKVDPKANI